MALHTLLHFGIFGRLAVATLATDRGVSETLGVLAMVLLTVFVAGVIGLFVLGEGP